MKDPEIIYLGQFMAGFNLKSVGSETDIPQWTSIRRDNLHIVQTVLTEKNILNCDGSLVLTKYSKAGTIDGISMEFCSSEMQKAT